MNSGATLILTRPEADSLALRQQMTSLGITSLVCPMLRIAPETSAQSQLDAAAPPSLILASSRHAFEALSPPQALQHTPLYMVGESTATAAKAHGWQGEQTIAPDIKTLLGLLPSTAHAALYLRGKFVTLQPQEALPNWQWQNIITYDAIATAQLSDETIAALTKPQPLMVALYSQRSAQLFEQAISGVAQAVNAPMSALCISDNVAQSLSLPLWRERLSAPAASQSAMLELIQKQIHAAK